MTVSAVKPIREYYGDGVTKVFQYPFRILQTSHMTVYFVVGGIATQQFTGFTVNGADQPSGGNVTFITAPGSDVIVRLVRYVPEQRTNNYVAGPILSEVLNDDFDSLEMQMQEISNQQIPVDSAGNYDFKGHRLTNVGYPIAGADGANVNYVVQALQAAASFTFQGDRTNTIFVDDYYTTASPRAQGTFGGDASANTVSGSPIVTLNDSCPGAGFLPQHVGMKLYCGAMDATNDYPTILSYLSPTQVTIDRNAQSTQGSTSIRLFYPNQNDTAAIDLAYLTAKVLGAKVGFGKGVYVYGHTMNVDHTTGIVGCGVNTTFGVPLSTTQKGDIFYGADTPEGFICTGVNFMGSGQAVGAHLNHLTLSGGELTATIDNGVVMDAGSRVMLCGARGTASAMRFTYFLVTGQSGGTITGSARTWDGRKTVANINSVRIDNGLVTMTTTGTHQMETADRVWINHLTGAADFLFGDRVSLTNTVVNTNQIQFTPATHGAATVVMNGTDATVHYNSYTFPNGAMTGNQIKITGFANAANNGIFTITSSTTQDVTFSNALGVNETGALGILSVYTMPPTATTGTLTHTADGDYSDTMSMVHDYNGLHLLCHPTQGFTITHRMSIVDNVFFRVQNAAYQIHQFNYGFFDKNQGTSCTFGLFLASASNSSGRFTNPSAFQVRGSPQLYGTYAGMVIVNAGGGSVSGFGGGIGGIGLLLDTCSGVSVTGWDIEATRAAPGHEELWPGHTIEMRAGTGNNFTGGFSIIGSTNTNTSLMNYFYAWAGANQFTYANVRHSAGTGYTQPIAEVKVTNDCFGYKIYSVNASLSTTTLDNFDIQGEGEWNILRVNTKKSRSYDEGLHLRQSRKASIAGVNYDSPGLWLTGSTSDGTGPVDDSYVIFTNPPDGTNVQSPLRFNHFGPGSTRYDFCGSGVGAPAFTTIEGASLTQVGQTATAGNNHNSPYITLRAKYHDGTVSQNDDWTLRNEPADNSTAPLGVLRIGHTGSPSLGRVEIGSTGLTLTSLQDSTSSLTGSFVTAGGAGFGKNVYIAGNLVVAGNVTSNGSGAAPVTVTTSTYSVPATVNTIIFNSGSTIAVTMPNAATYVGRVIEMKNIGSGAVNSGSSNIVPLSTATAGTSIFTGNGQWKRLRSDGTSWITMAGN